MENSAKTDNFLKAIHKYADEQRSAMHNEVELFKEEKIKEATAKGKADSDKFIKDSLEEKRNLETSKLAKIIQDDQNNLFLERVKMTENIFNTAKERLFAYTDTPEYKQLLLDSAKKIAKIFENEDCVIYINKKDIKASEQISSLFNSNAEIIADNSVKIGGIKGYCKAKSIIADETLDSKLYAQKDWFIENSKLSIL